MVSSIKRRKKIKYSKYSRITWHHYSHDWGKNQVFTSIATSIDDHFCDPYSNIKFHFPPYSTSSQLLTMVCPFSSSSHMAQPIIIPLTWDISLAFLLGLAFLLVCWKSQASMSILLGIILNTRCCVISTIGQEHLLSATHQLCTHTYNFCNLQPFLKFKVLQNKFKHLFSGIFVFILI